MKPRSARHSVLQLRLRTFIIRGDRMASLQSSAATALPACLQKKSSGFSLHREQNRGVFLLREARVSRAMTAKVWRERVTYTAMSLFVAWHTLAMVVAPAPGSSDLIKGLRTVLDPYLHFFRLDNQWNFFAPDVGEQGRDPLGIVLRYVIEDDAGKLHRFDPARRSELVSPELDLVPRVVSRPARQPGRLWRAVRRVVLPRARRHCIRSPSRSTRPSKRTTLHSIACAASSRWMPNSSK